MLTTKYVSYYQFQDLMHMVRLSANIHIRHALLFFIVVLGYDLNVINGDVLMKMGLKRKLKNIGFQF